MHFDYVAATCHSQHGASTYLRASPPSLHCIYKSARKLQRLPPTPHYEYNTPKRNISMKEAATATAKGRRTTDRGESSRGSSSSSGARYKGVRMRKWGKWVAEVRLPNSRDRIWLGSYDSPEKAARAYDAAVFCLRGPSASFNFPENPPEIPSAGNLTPEEIGRAARKFANEGGPPAEQTRAPTSQEVPQMEATTGLLNYYPPSPFDEFPAGWVFTREGEDDHDEEEEAQDTGPRLWSF